MTERCSSLVNGIPESCVALADRGFQYGDGTFTTLPVIHGRPVLLEKHLERLRRDATRLLIAFPDETVLRDEIAVVCRQTPDSVLKIILTRGGAGGRGYRLPVSGVTTRALTSYPLPHYPDTNRTTGIKLALSQVRLAINPLLAGIKHLNRLEQVMARTACSDPDAHEILMLDYEEYVVEAGMSNIFAVRNGVLQTPSLDRCGVAGVMRAHVIRLARVLGIPVQEIRMRLETVQQADEVFVTNSLFPLWPVRRFESRDYDAWPMARLLLDNMSDWRF